ncbi:MAG TPA: TetR/AcrR family transcriptional regulator [Acidimicrobiales bacterium]
MQRQRLLDDAMAAIRFHGSSVSVENIAAQAGVSKPVIYAEFGDKAGIADALALARAQQMERALIAQLADKEPLDTSTAVQLGASAFIGLLVDEPEIYGFIVRSMRDSDRGVLDNPLVRTLHDRVGMLISLLAPDADKAMVSVVTDGMFGFIFAMVESWQVSREPSQEEVVRMIVTLVQQGFTTISGQAIPESSSHGQQQKRRPA